jgi:predicted O-linked N-acetylglucosamine transferase (SPINDLY family)/MoaA/NifB/PqqE/SkfB family radical SAM enzyme
MTFKSSPPGYYRHHVGKPFNGAVLDVGLKCTHSCRFCRYSHLDGTENQFSGIRNANFKTPAECKRILDLFKEHSFINFDYTGGEPCLHPDIVEITRYAHQELGLKGRIITLGQWLMQKKKSSSHAMLIEELLEAGLTNFLFSFHAADEKLFRKITRASCHKLRKSMDYLDEKGFQYTSRTKVFEWNYKHLPTLAREVARHGIYLHSFIVANAYYDWNKDGRAFGLQPRYADLYPYLMEAVQILEANRVGVNIRCAPLCAVRGMEKNLAGMVGLRYDPHEWMHPGEPSGAAVVPLEEGDIEHHLQYRDRDAQLENGVKVTGARGNLNYFCDQCSRCGARSACDGIDPNYLKNHGSAEFTPYEHAEQSPVQSARRAYSPPFFVKTEQYVDMKYLVGQSFQESAQKEMAAAGTMEVAGCAVPKVSVVMACHDCGGYLPEAVRSVLDQTCQDFEIIIVSNGSNDNTAVAREMAAAHPRKVRAFHLSNSDRFAVSRNHGISEARGAYILCLDGHDKIAPTMLEECLHVLENEPGVAIVYTDRQDFDGSHQLVKARQYDLQTLRYDNQLSYCALFRSEVWRDVGGFRTNVKGCEDWDFWIAAGARGYTGRYIPKPLFLYRGRDARMLQEVILNFPGIYSRIVMNNWEVYSEDEVVGAARNCVDLLEPVPPTTVSDQIRERYGLLTPLLDGRQLRLQAAAEALVHGPGGIAAASLATGLSPSTIKMGCKELLDQQTNGAPASSPPESVRMETKFVQQLKAAWRGNLGIGDLVEFGDQLQAAGQPELVVVLYQTWLACNNTPENHLAYFNLGVLLSTLDKPNAAKDAYLKAIEVSPSFALPRINLGNIYERLGQSKAAVDQWSRVVDNTSTDKPEERSWRLLALNNLGRVLEIERDYGGALQHLSESLRIEPDQPDVIHHWVFLRAKQCLWPVYAPDAGPGMDLMRQSTSALAMIALSDDPAEQLSAATNYLTKKLNCNVPALCSKRSYAHPKTRIAYLSSDFCLHPVGMLTVELFELHDRQNFEIHGFCWTKEDQSALRHRIIESMDHFHRIDDLNDEAAARLIVEHEIDIVVDLHGQTLGARPVMLAYRPAPIQVTYLGLPATTGLPFIDYMIVDRFLVPEESLRYYTEKPIYMPDVYQVCDRKRLSAPVPTREACGLPPDGFVFCSFNNNYKYTPEMFTVWMNILRRVPGSVLWLLADNMWAESNMRKEAEARGIDCRRIIFGSRLAPEAYLARYAAADLFLDSFPFNAGTTANDALWMGLPVLTCTGRTFASRMAGALLTAAGLPELITYDFAAYENKAVELANDPRKCRLLQRHLRKVRKNGRLFDTERFTRNLEAHFARLVNALPLS